MLYSFRWENLGPVARSDPNVVNIRTSFINESGQEVCIEKKYREWMGVCTNHIDRIMCALEKHFPNSHPQYQHVGRKRKVLPYFPTRLTTQRLDSPSKPFYKVFLRIPLEQVGKFLKKYKISYYESYDWLVRLYIDLCDSHTQGFFYKWYTVTDSPWLLESFHMHPNLTHLPPFTVVAFDLETVPMDGGHRVPNGHDDTDEIVMISVYKWNSTRGVQKWLLYRPVPNGEPIEFPDGVAHNSEKSLLQDFHEKIKDAQILTGYNITGFDMGCIFARLIWLKMYPILSHYSSSIVGQHLVTTYQKKIVLDLYPYFKTFSNYDLPSFKLDDVARIKLGASKVPVKSTGLWCWYTRSEAALQLDAPVEQAYRVLQPHNVSLQQFGTFQHYMAYCLQDSFLVQQLFEKEMVLSFVIERANFTAWDAAKALYMGNSTFLLELFKTYGTALGFFINTRFFESPIDVKKYASVFGSNKTYQGALNYCIPEKAYDHVTVLDFASMYPSALVSSNLCYSTCTIMTRDEWLACPLAQELTTIPYRVHSERDFEEEVALHDSFRYPAFNPAVDTFAMVINRKDEGFLPCIVRHFIELRKHHQVQYKETQDVYHYNAQLNIKILINSLYGVMANKNSTLAYLPIAMSIVTLARYQLLGSFHFIKKCGYLVCYADTDSLMVHRWPDADARRINTYLNLPHVELKYEQCMKRLLVLSRKRYVYETQEGEIVTKGFQKRINDLLAQLTHLVLDKVWKTIYNLPSEEEAETNISLESRGWLIWVHVIQQAFYKCRDAKKYSITRKTKRLSEYKSTTCATVRMLKRYPEKANDYIDYTYSRADMAVREASKWVLDAEECQWVNYEQLIMSQKKMFCLLLNMAFWKQSKPPIEMCNHVMNTLRWKLFMHAELLYGCDHKRQHIELLVEKGTRYTFSVNDWAKRTTRPTRRRIKRNRDEVE